MLFMITVDFSCSEILSIVIDEKLFIPLMDLLSLILIKGIEGKFLFNLISFLLCTCICCLNPSTVPEYVLQFLSN